MLEERRRRRLRAAEFNGCSNGANGDVAHDEGRVLLLEFRSFVLLNTYAQNNGWTQESFAKRRRWTREVAAFIAETRVGATPRPGLTTRT